jgi:hypothetical protein
MVKAVGGPVERARAGAGSPVLDKLGRQHGYSLALGDRQDADDGSRVALRERFERAVRDALDTGTSLDGLTEVVRDFQSRGLSQAEATDSLGGLRASLAEGDEDRILELLDVVTGWCSPRMRIWNE